MSATFKIEAINLSTGHVFLAGGKDAQVTNWIDGCGREIPDFAGAVSAVVRVDDNNWLAVDLCDFKMATMQ